MWNLGRVAIVAAKRLFGVDGFVLGSPSAGHDKFECVQILVRIAASQLRKR
jgi:hypothetical protein